MKHEPLILWNNNNKIITDKVIIETY